MDNIATGVVEIVPKDVATTTGLLISEHSTALQLAHRPGVQKPRTRQCRQIRRYESEWSAAAHRPTNKEHLARASPRRGDFASGAILLDPPQPPTTLKSGALSTEAA